jgi:hypothetical protein
MTSGSVNGFENGLTPGRPNAARVTNDGESEPDDDHTYKCPQCGYTTDSEIGLKVHRSKTHDDDI